MKDKILEWERLTNQITENWVVGYFELSEEDEINFYWIGDVVGGVLEFADYFIGFQDILECYKHNISRESLFKWYEWCLENHSVNISLVKYILSPQKRKEQEEKHLAELKERVKLSEKEFKEALENYNNSNRRRTN